MATLKDLSIKDLSINNLSIENIIIEEMNTQRQMIKDFKKKINEYEELSTEAVESNNIKYDIIAISFVVVAIIGITYYATVLI